jgi:hypothetical protein
LVLDVDVIKALGSEKRLQVLEWAAAGTARR